MAAPSLFRNTLRLISTCFSFPEPHADHLPGYSYQVVSSKRASYGASQEKVIQTASFGDPECKSRARIYIMDPEHLMLTTL